MTAAVVCPVEADAIDVCCHACGTEGSATSLVGDVMGRVRAFAHTHLDPRIVRIHFVNAQTRAPLGWMDA